MKTDPGLSVVIVSYNVREFLDACLQSVYHAIARYTGPVEVIVFDNDSRDGTVSLLSPKWPDVTWIASDRNLGFGTGCNRGAAVASHEILLFLNPDSLVGEDTFKVWGKFFSSRDDLGVVGCKIVNRDGSLQPACKRSFPSPRVAAFKLMGLSNLFPKSRVFGAYNLTYLDESQTHEVDAVSGSFLSLGRELFREVGGFDEDFFMYGEDLDLCYRVKRLGKKNVYHPEAQVIHFKGESAKSRPLRSFFNFYEAMVIFSRKHLDLRTLPLAFLNIGVATLALVNFLSDRLRQWPRWLADLFLVNTILFVVTYAYQRARGYPHTLETIQDLYLFWHFLISLSVILPLFYLGEYGRNIVKLRKTSLSLSFSFLFFLSLSFFFKEAAYSRVVFGLTAMLSSVVLIGWRLAGKQGGRFWRKIMGSIKRVAILGTDERALSLANLLQSEKLEGYEFVGFIHFPPGPIPIEVRVNVIGDLEALNGLARRLDIQAVIIALQAGSYPAAIQLLTQHGNPPYEVKMLVGGPEMSEISLIDLNFGK